MAEILRGYFPPFKPPQDDLPSSLREQRVMASSFLERTIGAALRLYVKRHGADRFKRFMENEMEEILGGGK